MLEDLHVRLAGVSIPVTATAVKSLDSTLRYTLARRVGDGVMSEGRNPMRYRVC